MPEHHWRLPALISTLDDETLLAQPLLGPDVSCFALDGQRLKKMLAARVADGLKAIPPGELYRYLLAELPEVRTLQLQVPALRDDLPRRNPINLRLQYVVWRHGVDALIAFIPWLGIEILARDESQLVELLEPQMTMALSRSGVNKSLRLLTELSRFCELKVRPLRLKLKLPTLKEAALERESAAEKEKSLLREVASNLATYPSRPVYERDADVQRLAELLTRRNPQSVLLVGRSGVGKSALVQQLARRCDSLGLGLTPMWSTSGSRIVAGMTGFGMWQQRCEKIVREASRTKALLHLGNLVELIEVGKGGGSLQGVAAFLRPHLDRGAFLSIVECTPEQLAIIEREGPQLLETFTQFELAPSSPEQTRAILRAVSMERNDGPRLPLESLATLDRLHRRWATYSAAPGRQLRFLRNLLEDRGRLSARNGSRTNGPKSELREEITPAEVTAAFSRETGLPLFMLDDDLRLDLNCTQSWFADRVIGQPEAVRQVVDLLAAVKTGLARGGKPIASLLFIGPTGVGKTEMAKALAEFLYQDRSRMIRFDMSEYSHPSAIERLIGGAYSAQGQLTQKVRDQPFTVVLLDEFEKAHPQFFDVLLQVLGEGRLTDGVGRVTDFTNSVVIMTSNLGAESYRRGAGGFAGQSAAVAAAASHFEREVKAFLRPELFNRLDRIVPFSPLDRTTITRIARRELDHVLGREGLRFRGIEVPLDDAVGEHLADAGFDPRYGARPLKRTIEQELIAPLAEGINRYTSEHKLTCRTQLVDGRLKVDVEALPADAFADPTNYAPEAIERVVGLRRHVQALKQSSILTRLRNEIERIRQARHTCERRLEKRGQPVRYGFTPEQARLLGHEQLLQRVEKLAQDVIALENDCLSRLYGVKNLDIAMIGAQWADLDTTLRELLFDLPQIEQPRGGQLTIAAFGESMPAIVELMSIYHGICQSHGDSMRWFWLKMYREELDESLLTARPIQPAQGPRPIARLLSRQEKHEEVRVKLLDVYDPAQNPFEQIPSDCMGLAVTVSGSRSVALLQTESGQHEFLRADGVRQICFVETVMDRLLKYDPPRDVGRRGSLANLRWRRTYNFREAFCSDPLLKRQWPIKARRLDGVTKQAVEEYLTQRLWELIEAWS